jgi:hypothetical protein
LDDTGIEERTWQVSHQPEVRSRLTVIVPGQCGQRIESRLLKRFMIPVSHKGQNAKPRPANEM